MAELRSRGAVEVTQPGSEVRSKRTYFERQRTYQWRQ